MARATSPVLHAFVQGASSHSRQRAAYDTMMIWSRAYGKNVTGRENWDNMVVDFNAHINDIYQIARSGIEIK